MKNEKLKMKNYGAAYAAGFINVQCTPEFFIFHFSFFIIIFRIFADYAREVEKMVAWICQ